MTYVVHVHGEGQAETADAIYGGFANLDNARAFADRVNARVEPINAQGLYHIFAAVELVRAPLIRNVKADGWLDGLNDLDDPDS